jgi:hypothetical protein
VAVSLIATDPLLVPLPAAVTTLLLTMAADVGVEANVNPPVGRDWLADDLGAAWAVRVAGLGAYAPRASKPATTTSDAAAIRSRGVKRLVMPLSFHYSADPAG